MPNVIETYGQMVRAYEAQQDRVLGRSGDRWTGDLARRFRDDPRRTGDEVLDAIAEYARPEDVFLDVGGGAGRYGLPMALRCRELIDVDPSGGMKAEFESICAEEGIKNARYVHANWLTAEGFSGDVSLVSNVTYFVADIEPFIRKLVAATRRRAIIRVNSTPPPNGGAPFFKAAYGEAQDPVPGHRELLPVLWELGIVPDVRVFAPTGPTLFANRDAALNAGLGGNWIRGDERDKARALIDQHFDELFVPTAGGFKRRDGLEPRPMLITWETTT